MNAFTIILIIIVCIILFTYFYNLIVNFSRYEKKKGIWPPEPRQMCPDYWVQMGTGDNIVCRNVFGLGTGLKNSGTPIPQVNLKGLHLPKHLHGCESDQFAPKCMQAKCEWAKQTNNPWFGVGPNCDGDADNPECYCPS